MGRVPSHMRPFTGPSVGAADLKLEKSVQNLRWCGGTAIRAYGLTLGIRTTDHRLPRSIRSIFPYGSEASNSRRVDFLYSIVVGKDRQKSTLWLNSELVLRSRDMDHLL